MEKIRWKYQGNTYGMVDFKMKCHGELFWRLPAIGNPDGEWDPIMDCVVCRKSKVTFTLDKFNNSVGVRICPVDRERG